MSELHRMVDGKSVPLTEQEIAEYNDRIIANSQVLAEKARTMRNSLLAASDWTQVADAPVDQAAWATYRQALRDITSQEGFPENVVWPTKPE